MSVSLSKYSIGDTVVDNLWEDGDKGVIVGIRLKAYDNGRPRYHVEWDKDMPSFETAEALDEMRKG